MLLPKKSVDFDKKKWQKMPHCQILKSKRKYYLGQLVWNNKQWTLNKDP